MAIVRVHRGGPQFEGNPYIHSPGTVDPFSAIEIHKEINDE